MLYFNNQLIPAALRLEPAVNRSLKPSSLASQAARLAMMRRTRAALDGPLAVLPGLSQSCQSQGHALCHAETAACADAICWCHEKAQRAGTGPEIRSLIAVCKLCAWRQHTLNAFRRGFCLQYLRTAVPYFLQCEQLLSRQSGKQDISTLSCAFKRPFHVWLTRCCAMWGSTRCSAAATRSACRAPTTTPKSASCKFLDRGMLWPMRSGTCHSFSSAHTCYAISTGLHHQDATCHASLYWANSSAPLAKVVGVMMLHSCTKARTQAPAMCPAFAHLLPCTCGHLCCGRSCAKAGYFKDDFIHLFVRKSAKRSPLINRGAQLTAQSKSRQTTNNTQHTANITAQHSLHNPTAHS